MSATIRETKNTQSFFVSLPRYAVHSGTIEIDTSGNSRFYASDVASTCREYSTSLCLFRCFRVADTYIAYASRTCSGDAYLFYLVVDASFYGFHVACIEGVQVRAENTSRECPVTKQTCVRNLIKN